jgi:hypothetical protein
MRCYYPYVNFIPNAVTREDQFGRLKGCSTSSPPTTSKSTPKPTPTAVSLSEVLAVGNNAGTNDILMNGQKILGAHIIETDILEFDDGINGVSIIQLSGTILSYLAGANSSSHEFITKSNTGIQSTPVTISSNSTTITNATTINNLSSTTQPNGTNDTTVATTAFVQNSISALPTNYMPYFYGETINYLNTFVPLGQFGFGISNAVNWGENAYFTIRCNFEQSFIQGSTAPFTYFQSWSFLMDIYPYRLINMISPNIYLLNGTINGNSNYNYNDPTYAPTNRPYWTRIYNNSSELAPNSNTPIPVYITSTTASPSANFIFNFNPPLNTNPCAWRFSATCEIINLGNNPSPSTITSYGLSTSFSGGTYYSTF